MSLPADIRKRLGLADGGALLVEETPDGIVLRTVAQSIAHAQALARKYTADKPEASVDAFLATRRAESGE
jgi:AbrB family looped-hinge helix DNA binding protein